MEVGTNPFISIHKLPAPQPNRSNSQIWFSHGDFHDSKYSCVPYAGFLARRKRFSGFTSRQKWQQGWEFWWNSGEKGGIRFGSKVVGEETVMVGLCDRKSLRISWKDSNGFASCSEIWDCWDIYRKNPRPWMCFPFARFPIKNKYTASSGQKKPSWTGLGFTLGWAVDLFYPILGFCRNWEWIEPRRGWGKGEMELPWDSWGFRGEDVDVSGRWFGFDLHRNSPRAASQI